MILVVLFKLTEASVMYHTENVKKRKSPFISFPGFVNFKKGILSLEKETVIVYVCVCSHAFICLHLAISQITTGKRTKVHPTLVFPDITQNHPPLSSKHIQEKSVHFSSKPNET